MITELVSVEAINILAAESAEPGWLGLTIARVLMMMRCCPFFIGDQFWKVIQKKSDPQLLTETLDMKKANLICQNASDVLLYLLTAKKLKKEFWFEPPLFR